MNTSRRPTLAFVSGWLPDPEGTGSEQRSFSFLKAYARHFDVDLWFSARPYSWEFSRISKLTPYCRSARFFHHKLLKTNTDNLQDEFNASVAAADHVHLFKLPFGIGHKSVLWDYDELPLALREPGKWKIESADRAFQTFSRATRLMYCSSPLELSSDIGRASIVPNCYHVTDARRSQTPPGNMLLFTGTFGYMPNITALQFFVKEVLPSLPPEVTLMAVGRKPRHEMLLQAMQDIAETPRVHVHYNVPSCSPFYDSAAAAIVPLLDGTGTRLKILEAFAHRCPVVSTSKGCEGLDVADGRELLVRDDPRAFADACLQALHEQPLRKSLATKALRFLKLKNSQEAAERAIDHALSEAGVMGAPD